MNVEPLPIAGASLLHSAVLGDERGGFQRLYCATSLRSQGIDFRTAQASLATNPAAGTLRGLHFQRPPHAESKIVRCLNGALFDVFVDVRPGSPTFGRWHGVELVPSGPALLLPAGVAHGYLTRRDDTRILYLMDRDYVAQAAGGLRWDDPEVAIDWPGPITVLSDKDRGWPTLRELEARGDLAPPRA